MHSSLNPKTETPSGRDPKKIGIVLTIVVGAMVVVGTATSMGRNDGLAGSSSRKSFALRGRDATSLKYGSLNREFLKDDLKKGKTVNNLVAQQQPSAADATGTIHHAIYYEQDKGKTSCAEMWRNDGYNVFVLIAYHDLRRRYYAGSGWYTVTPGRDQKDGGFGVTRSDFGSSGYGRGIKFTSGYKYFHVNGDHRLDKQDGLTSCDL